METTVGLDTEHVLEQFRQGQLTEQTLRQALTPRAAAGLRQDLLYLQVSSSGLTASVLGLTLVRAGEIVDLPVEQWPYANVLAALRDGWRIVKFPDLGLLMVDARTLGLGCEFILEQWS